MAEQPSRRPSEDSADDPPPAAAPQPPVEAPAPAPPGATGAHPVTPRWHHADKHPKGKRLALLSLTALGIVYGDIGTSPLYALQQCFSGEYGMRPTQDSVFGILSLFFWALILVVCVKYIVFILRADNRGE